MKYLNFKSSQSQLFNETTLYNATSPWLVCYQVLRCYARVLGTVRVKIAVTEKIYHMWWGEVRSYISLRNVAATFLRLANGHALTKGKSSAMRWHVENSNMFVVLPKHDSKDYICHVARIAYMWNICMTCTARHIGLSPWYIKKGKMAFCGKNKN